MNRNGWSPYHQFLYFRFHLFSKIYSIISIDIRIYCHEFLSHFIKFKTSRICKVLIVLCDSAASSIIISPMSNQRSKCILPYQMMRVRISIVDIIRRHFTIYSFAKVRLGVTATAWTSSRCRLVDVTDVTRQERNSIGSCLMGLVMGYF